jgi:hypothetical protein
MMLHVMMLYKTMRISLMDIANCGLLCANRELAVFVQLHGRGFDGVGRDQAAVTFPIDDAAEHAAVDIAIASITAREITVAEMTGDDIVRDHALLRMAP